MDEKKKMLLADFALLLAATFWGMGFVAGDMAAKAFPTFWIMTVRFLGAAVWMGLLFRRAVHQSQALAIQWSKTQEARCCTCD